MRVGVVHSFYRRTSPSGENLAVVEQVEALREAGIDVIEHFRFTDVEERRPDFRLRSAAVLATGFDHRSERGIVRELETDILSVHNTWPNFGERSLSKYPGPLVVNVHNFRSSCANGLFYRNGQLCTECASGRTWPAVRHGCYQGSWSASVPAAISTVGGASRNALLQRADAVITQNTRVRDFLSSTMKNPERIHLIPGFTIERHTGAVAPPEVSCFIVVGRNTPEKGLGELLSAWPRDFRLDVVGSEPSEAVSGRASSVRFLGRRDHSWILEELPNYAGLVFPGRVWEGAYPRVVREAMEAGVPVVALEGSAAADLVLDNGVGVTYADESADSLQEALKTVLKEGSVLRERCRVLYKQQLTASVWLERTVGLYTRLIQGSP